MISLPTELASESLRTILSSVQASRESYPSWVIDKGGHPSDISYDNVVSSIKVSVFALGSTFEYKGGDIDVVSHFCSLEPTSLEA